MPRVLSDIVTAFQEYVSPLPAHRLFKKWGGVFLLSGALTRRVWLITNEAMPQLFPNFILMLVGVPATGKDLIINKVEDCLIEASQDLDKGYSLYLAERDLSPKGLLDSIASDDAQQTLRYLNGSSKEQSLHFHSLISCIPELGTFMHEYNPQLIAIINDLYNCGKHYKERIRGGVNRGQQIFIPNPHAAFFLGTQPATLNMVFPESAYRAGFFSRVVIVHGDKPVKQNVYDLEGETKIQPQLWNKIVSDMRNIVKLSGQFKVERDVKIAVNEFNKHEADKTKLSHSRFTDYNSRRHLHLQKLAMIFSISESNELTVKMRHWERALSYLLEAEKEMPGVFKNICTDSGFATTVEEVVTGSEGKVLKHERIERILQRRHKPYEVGHIIKSMISSGYLQPQDPDKLGRVTYKVRSAQSILD